MTIEVVNGSELYICGKCNSNNVYLLNREKIDATATEKQNELDMAKFISDAAGLEMEKLIVPELDFYRWGWTFKCEECGCLTNVITEIDRY